MKGLHSEIVRHKNKSIQNMIKNALIVGCLLGVGIVIGSVLVGHQSSIKSLSDGNPSGESLAASRSKREATVSPTENVRNRTPNPTGALYTRWGRSVCPPGAGLVYRGVMASGHSGHPGGGNEYLCMVEKPQWGKVISGTNAYSYIYGVEFKAHDNLFNKDQSPNFVNHDGNCAVCRTTRTVQLMVPGTQTCMEGWTREYYGYLMSSKHDEKSQRNYVCVDVAPEADREGYRADGGGTLWPVEAVCGSLPCPDYINGNEVTCVVCSQ